MAVALAAFQVGRALELSPCAAAPASSTIHDTGGSPLLTSPIEREQAPLSPEAVRVVAILTPGRASQIARSPRETGLSDAETRSSERDLEALGIARADGKMVGVESCTAAGPGPTPVGLDGRAGRGTSRRAE